MKNIYILPLILFILNCGEDIKKITIKDIGYLEVKENTIIKKDLFDYESDVDPLSTILLDTFYIKNGKLIHTKVLGDKFPVEGYSPEEKFVNQYNLDGLLEKQEYNSDSGTWGTNTLYHYDNNNRVVRKDSYHSRTPPRFDKMVVYVYKDSLNIIETYHPDISSYPNIKEIISNSPYLTYMNKLDMGLIDLGQPEITKTNNEK